MNIKKLFQHIKNAFTKFLSGVSKIIVENADQAIQIAENIKSYLNSPTASIITALIPGTWDDALVAEAKSILDKIMPELLGIKACSELPDEQARYACYMNLIGEMSPKMKNAFLFKFASAYLTQKHNELMEHQSDSIIQGRFIESKPA